MSTIVAKSLRQLRKNPTAKVPEHACSNCKCKRYSPCTCAIKSGFVPRNK